MQEIEFENLSILSYRRFRGKIHVIEYLDITTGEIFDAKEVARRGMKSIRPDASRRRKEKLDSLRKEVRDFAIFVLKFRSRTGRFLMPLDDLVKWYGKLVEKDAKHIRRYIPRLVEKGILDFDRMLNPDFMWVVTEIERAEVRGEVFTAYRIYDELRLRKRCRQGDEQRRLAA